MFIRFSGDSADGASDGEPAAVAAAEAEAALSTEPTPGSSAVPSTQAPPSTTLAASPSVSTAAAVPDAAGEGSDADATDAGPVTGVAGLEAPVPAYGGAVRVGIVGAPQSLNPLGLDSARESVMALRHAVTAGAIRLDPETRDPVAMVVNEVPTLENGGLEVLETGELRVRLEIRDDAVWSDGTPITADDFLQTYAVALQASGVPPDVRERYGLITSGSLIGEGGTVEYRLRAPGLTFLELFGVLVPAHEVTVAGFSSEWDDTMWAAGGPFRFFGFDPDASTLTLIANQRSWLTAPDSGDPLPYLDRLEFVYYPTLDELVAGVQAGEVDVARVGDDPAVIDSFAADSQFLLDVRRGPGWEQMGFQFGSGRTDVNPESLLADVDVRRAIATVVDRGALVDAVQGAFGTPLESITSTSWSLDRESPWTSFDQDPTEAVRLLTEAAANAEVPPVLSFATTSNDVEREELARLLVDALEPIGFSVAITRTEPGAHFFDFVIPGEFEAAAWAWQSAPGPVGAVDDFRDRHVLDWPTGTDFYNWGASDDPAFEAFAQALDDVGATVGLEGVRDGLASLEAALADAVPLLPLYAELNGAVAAVDVVGGFEHSTLPAGHLAGVAGWWRIETD